MVKTHPFDITRGLSYAIVGTVAFEHKLDIRASKQLRLSFPLLYTPISNANKLPGPVMIRIV